MKQIDDKLWSAYLDGELSVTEIEKLEADLSTEQLEHLRKEKALESKVAERLQQDVKCPDELWQSITKQVEKEKKQPIKWVNYAVLAAIAAVLVFFIFIDNKDYGTKVPTTVQELKDISRTTADLDGVNSFLKDKEVQLQLLELPQGHHKKKIIGATMEVIAGEEVVTLLFECCGRPVKVYVLPRNSAAERMVQNEDNSWKGGIQGSSKRGNYRLALVSKHAGLDILNAITAS